jgi:hypothetical protein
MVLFHTYKENGGKIALLCFLEIKRHFLQKKKKLTNNSRTILFKI